jgi:NADPH:quinone reductase-like Zn-dependent oxidoreductase
MKPAVIGRFGGPDEIPLRTLPVPKVDATEILIKIHAVGVGVWDADVREGSWRPFGTIHFPLILGTDRSGSAFGS